MARKIGMSRPVKNTDSNNWEAYLDPDEKLIWQGAPATGLRFSGSGFILSFFGIFFLAFALFWTGIAASMGGDSGIEGIFPLFGVPFVLIGLWLVAGHWFFDAYKRKRSRYALTNKRAIIARTVFNRRMESYPIERANQIRLISGTLDTVHFAQKTYRTKNGTSVKNIGFRFIQDGQAVYDLLRKVQEVINDVYIKNIGK